MFNHLAFVLIALGLPSLSLAWEEQQALDFILAYSPVIRAYRTVTKEYIPSTPMQRILEHTSLFARASQQGNTAIVTDSFITTGTTAGIQINIPLFSRKEEREHALKALEEIKAIEEVRAGVLHGPGAAPAARGGAHSRPGPAQVLEGQVRPGAAKS